MVAIHKPAHDVILKPVVSEKSYAASDRGQYTFVVAPDANKVQIKQAIALAPVSASALPRSVRS